MRMNIGFGMMLLAASLSMPAFGQIGTARPRARSASSVSSSGYLGIGAKDVDSERAKALKMSEVRGAEIVNVMEEGPASKAGFQVGDVVTEYNGQKVEGIEQLTRMVSETPAGRQVKVQVWRNGVSMTLTPTLEASHSMIITGNGNVFSMPEVRIPEITIPPIPPMEMPKFSMSYQNGMLGIIGESLGQEEQLADFFGVKDGVLIKSVSKDSPAEKAGLKAGDVIVKVDDTRVFNTRDITNTLRASRTKKTVTVLVVRNKKEMPISVTIEATSAGVRAMVIGPLWVDTPTFEVNWSSPWLGNKNLFKPLVVKPLKYEQWFGAPVVVLEFPAKDRVI